MTNNEKEYIIQVLKKHLKWLRGYTNHEFEIQATIKAIKKLED